MRFQAMTRVLAVGVALGCSLGFGSWTTAQAQTSTGTIRGYVRDAQGKPIAGANVTATQPETNVQRNVLTTETGFFNMPGLTPGSYVLKTSMLGFGDQERPVRVLIGQVTNLELSLSAQAIALAGLQVQVTRTVETTTPEIATNITPEQMEAVPMNDRNFLSLAALAPGVTFGCQGNNCPPGDAGGLSSGGGSADNSNVFVDGVSLKNEILRGGVAGQDASKGNPFPQNAVQEFRVITQQFKAEYPKATGAVVVATTRSGTNRWEAGAFGFRQNTGLIEQGFFALETCRVRQQATPPLPCAAQPKQDRWQMGGNVGGPIIRDKLFFFASYEGNHQDRAETVNANATNLAQWPTTIQQELLANQGTFPSEFRSNLVFGKLTYTPGERHRFELSGNIRDEFDIRGFGGTNGLENAEDFNNDVRSVLAKHQYNRGNLLNEAQASYQYYQWLPVQLNVDLIGREYQNTMKIGGRCCPQDRKQKKLSLKDDVSYTVPNWAGDHVFKFGASVDFAQYDVSNPLQINPQFFFVPASPTIPQRVNVGFGQPGVVVDNTQVGFFVQDDWSPIRRLILNLGVRWDYESNALNNDYVTPPAVISELGSRNDLLIFSPAEYFTDGDDRPAFKGAFQPRLGFSYDVSGTNSTVLFGGFGVYHDRLSLALTEAEMLRLTWKVYEIRFSADGSTAGTIPWSESYYSRDALQALIQSGTTGKPEVFLLENDTRPPRSNHFSLGVRQAWRDFLISVNYSGVRSYNNFTWHFANRNPQTGRTFETPSYRNVLVSTDEGRAWYDGVYAKVEKTYTRASRWGGAINYTLGWADDEFSAGRPFAGLDFHTPDKFVRRRSERDQRHSISANAIVGLPLDVRLSGILNLGTGRPFRVFYGGDACTTGNLDCLGNEYPNVSVEEAVRLAQQGTAACCATDPFTGEPDTQSFLGIDGWTFRNIDLRIEKEFQYAGHRLGLVAEGFNVFNFDNFINFEGRIANLTPAGGVTNVNVDATTMRSNVGKPLAAITDTRNTGAPRRWQFGLRWGMVR